MSLVGFRAQHHQQQLVARGPRPAVDNRATPPELFAVWHKRYHFTIDACALPASAKLPRFWTPDDDGLAQSWAGERVWCNPPYSLIEPWVVKAATGGAALVAMLLPANRTEQRWWQDHIEPVRDRPGGPRTEFLPGRLRFIAEGATRVGANERPPFGCVLLVWGDDG